MTTIEIVPATRPRPPRPVRIAVSSVFAGVALYVIVVAVQITGYLLHRTRLPRPPRVSLSDMTTAYAVAGLIMIGICALAVFLALRMRRGSSSARTTLVVLAAVNLALFAATTALGHLGHAGVLVLVVDVVVAVAEIVFIAAAFHRETRAFLAPV